MLREKVETEFCGLSDEEKKLIKKKESDIRLDFNIRYYMYENVYEVFNNYGLIAILEILEEHLTFIKEQKIKILNKYNENENLIHEFLNDINDIFLSLPIDVEEISPKFFKRAKDILFSTENYKCLINNVFDEFSDMLSRKDIETKVEIMNLFSSTNRKTEN